MDNTFNSLLQELGLNAEEAQVYNALLEVGQSVVTPVATLAGVNRTTCYNILESLVAKKLAKRSNYRGKMTYSAEDPSQLVANLEQQKKQLELTIEKARAVEPELTKRYAQKFTKPIIKYVQGDDGLIELYEDSLRCQDKTTGILSYTSMAEVSPTMHDYAQRYYKERTKRGIPIKGIVPDTEAGKHIKKIQNDFLRTARLVPHEKFNFSPEIYLYDNKLSVMSFTEKFGFVVESKEIVDALKIAWQLAWERAEEYDKEIKI